MVFGIGAFVDVDTFVILHPPSEWTPTFVCTGCVDTDTIDIVVQVVVTWAVEMITWIRRAWSTFIVIIASLSMSGVAGNVGEASIAFAVVTWLVVDTDTVVGTFVISWIDTLVNVVARSS